MNKIWMPILTAALFLGGNAMAQDSNPDWPDDGRQTHRKMVMSIDEEEYRAALAALAQWQQQELQINASNTRRRSKRDWQEQILFYASLRPHLLVIGAGNSWRYNSCLVAHDQELSMFDFQGRFTDLKEFNTNARHSDGEWQALLDALKRDIQQMHEDIELMEGYANVCESKFGCSTSAPFQPHAEHTERW